MLLAGRQEEEGKNNLVVHEEDLTKNVVNSKNSVQNALVEELFQAGLERGEPVFAFDVLEK